MTQTDYQHFSVMLPEVVEALAIQPEGIYIDATLGRGGHAKAILERLGPKGKMFAIDKDPQALSITQKNLGSDERIEFCHGSFTTLEDVAKRQAILQKVDGILFDLGVSSPQLEDPARGFSFLHDGPLDMRMDNTQGQTAAEWLVVAKESEISKVLFEFGEERFARRIAHAITLARTETPILTTKQLAEIVSKANPAWEKGKHPATRAFQAIRIYINQELKDLQDGLEQALEILAIGGRLVVISFHSLEDRIVKRFIRRHSRGEILPAHLPILATEEKPRLRGLGRGIKPTGAEIAANPRARSATLRIAEKLL